MREDSPTTQLRMRREASDQIALPGHLPRHEPLTAARGILFGALAGGLVLVLLVAGARALWRALT